MTKYLYLYESPFVVADNTRNRNEYLSQSVRLSEFERDDEELVRSLILKFMIDHNLVIITDKSAIGNSGKNTSSINWLMNWKNFRGIVAQREFDDMLMVLESSNSEFITAIIDLHSHLGMRVDNTLLNTLITRTMRSIQIIPYSIPDTDNELSWEYIFKTLPFIWIIILIQSIIRSDTTPK